MNSKITRNWEHELSFKFNLLESQVSMFSSIYKETCKLIRKLKIFKVSYFCTVPKIRNTNFPRNETAGLAPNFYNHVSGSDLYIFMISLIWNLINSQTKKKLTTMIICFSFMIRNFPNWKFVCWPFMWTLSSTSGAEGKAGNCRQPVLGSRSLPLSLLLWFSQEFVTQYCTSI